MKTELLTPSQYQKQLWKNGKGSTAEIAISPVGAIFPADPFLWRLSSAELTEACAFSQFQNYSRYLALFKGQSMGLKFGQEIQERLLKAGEVMDFSGSDSASCTLPEGPVTDLGLIIDPKKVRADFKIFQFRNKPRSIRTEGSDFLIFTIQGSIIATVYPGEERLTLKTGETLRVSTLDHGVPKEHQILLEPSPGSNRSVALIDLKLF